MSYFVCNMFQGQRMLGSTWDSTEFASFFSLSAKPIHPRSPALSVFCIFLQFSRSEGTSLHRDIMTLIEHLISCVSLSGLNYCRQALSQTASSQHTCNTFLFKLWNPSTYSHQDSTHCRLLSPALPLQICLLTACINRLSFSFTYSLHCWT